MASEGRKQRRAAERTRAAAARKVAQGAARVLDPRARAAERISSAAYQEALAWEAEDGPMAVMAPVSVGCKAAALPVARHMCLEETEETVRDVAAMLAAGFLELVTRANREDFERWRASADAAENAATRRLEQDAPEHGGPAEG